MTKKIFSLVFSIFAAAALFAADLPSAPAPPPVKASTSPAAAPLSQWDFFILCFLPDVPKYALTCNTFGVKVGAPVSFGDGLVRGVETAVFGSMTQKAEGVQCAVLYCWSKNVFGVQASPVNYCGNPEGLQFAIVNVADDADGLQLGVFNYSGKDAFQLGILNYIKDSAIPFMPIFNIKF